MMIRIFSSTYIVAALATMAMTMTYSNGVVSAAPMNEAAATAVNNTQAAANEAIANILNLGAACKPKPFVAVCTASDCICGEYFCDAQHICGNCPMVSGVRVSPCDSGNVTNVGDDGDNDAAMVAAIKDAMATPTVNNATDTVDWGTDSSNNTSFVTDAANENVQATVDAAKEAIANAQATVDTAPAATATDAVNTAAATETDAAEVSSASVLSASMIGIAAVTTAFVAIA